MNKIQVIVLWLVVALTTETYAGMTVEQYKSSPDPESIDTYLAGVLNGFAFANTELQDQKRKPLFCPASDLVITVEVGRSKLENGLKRYKKFSLPLLEIEPMLLRELMESYPCKK